MDLQLDQLSVTFTFEESPPLFSRVITRLYSRAFDSLTLLETKFQSIRAYCANKATRTFFRR